MITLLARDLVQLWPDMMDLHSGFGMGGEDVPTPADVHKTLGAMKRFSDSIGWSDLSRQTVRLQMKIAENPSNEVLEALVLDLVGAFEGKLKDIWLGVVPETDSALLTDAVNVLCSGALDSRLAVSEEELNLSAKAIAFGLSTAAVSHAMRSVESSLHVLAAKLGHIIPRTHTVSRLGGNHRQNSKGDRPTTANS